MLRMSNSGIWFDKLLNYFNHKRKKIASFISILSFIGQLYAATETLSTGSFIINMGVTPQTVNNGLKPYGLIFDLLQNCHVPIKWIINQSKGKDGIDFTYNSVDYKGGTFIIPAEYRTTTVNARITFWIGQGVVGVTTTSPISVPVQLTMTNAPNWTLDQQNGSIAEGYLLNAMIPDSAWSFKDPTDLTCCDDVFAMPHADPLWSSHSRLLSWNDECNGSIWAACHAVSALENLYNPADTAAQMNFLSNKIPKSPKPSPYAENSLLIWGDHGNGSPPYDYFFHVDPFMQFMGTMDDAMTNGSEQIYMPVLTGSWRASTKLAVIDPSQSNIPVKSPGPAVAVAYGRAFGNNNNGMVMYEAGHSHNKDQGPPNIAAQRIMLNFSFFASIEKSPSVTINISQDTLTAGLTYNIDAIVSSAISSSPYTYLWSTLMCDGSFANAMNATTTYTPACVVDTTHCILRVIVTDACGRLTFMDKMIVIVNGKPNAGNDQTVSCVASFPGGSATMAAVGSGTWSSHLSNPGTANIANTTLFNTTITNFSVAGTYNFIWTNPSGCAKDTASVVVTAKPNAGPNQNVNCVASFSGGSAKMAAAGSGTWSEQTGNPGTSSITNNTLPTTTITNFGASGTYNFIWSGGTGCTDTASVIVTAKPNAGNDQSVNCIVSFPGGSATMNGSGTGTWTSHPANIGTASITNTTSPTTTITTFSVAGTYIFIWTNESCSDTASVIVTAKPNAGNDQNVNCLVSYPAGLATMSANGVGTWTAQAGNPPATITSPFSPTTTITNFSSSGTYFFIWTNASNCSDTAMVIVTSKPNGGADQFVNCVTSFPGGSATMAATGSGTWTPQTGNLGTTTITNATSPITTIIDFSGIGTYSFIWTNASNCNDTVKITVSQGPIGSASPQTICSGGTSSVALTSTIPGTTFTWTVAQFSGAAIIGFSNCAVACGTSISQTLNNASNTIAGVVKYTVTPKSPNGCVGNTFTVDVTVNPLPAVNVTTTPACIGFNNGSATANASGGILPYGYNWSNGQTTATISNVVAATYTVTVTDGNSCSNTSTGTVLSQGISSLTAIPGICQSLTNTYSLTGDITFQNAPSSGTLIVNVGATQQVFNAPFIGPQNYTLNGLTADGAVHTVTATFSGGANCTKLTNYTAPVNCSPMISHNKTFISYTQTGINTYDVLYKITVTNTGGEGFYGLKDIPSYDDDIAINSASYTTDAPGNAGNPGPAVLAGVGNWTLASGQSMAANSTQMYTLKVNVTINLNPLSSGDNVYKKCGQTTPSVPVAGEGLFNESSLDSNNDGISDQKSTTCGDLPYVTHDKTITNIVPLGANMHLVNYQIVVKNIGGATAQYDLVDSPAFDNDININTASYLSNAPGNPGGILVGSGPWALSNDQSIAVGSIHTYQLSVKVTLDLTAGSGGDNVYRKCGQTTPGDPSSGEGVYNESKMDSNNDGIPEEVDEVCGDLPYVTHDKIISSIAPLGGNMFNVTYKIVVKNLGGVNGQYDLKDIPGFDDDITINTALYTSDAPGNVGLALSLIGPWILANDQNILTGATHTYLVKVKVTIDLNVGSGGDNIYRKCGTAIPGDPTAGEGLYNASTLDSNNDGIPEENDEVCDDLPFITNSKIISSIIPLGGNMYNVTYQLEVKNLGGVNGQYDLIDVPGFDNDININTTLFTTTAPGNPGGVLLGTGPWTLTNDQAILAGASHTYTLTVKVTLDLSVGSGGDNVYRKCGQTTPGDPSSGEGLYNESRLDSNNDAIPEESDKVCGDLPYIITIKTIGVITSLGNNMYQVNYQIDVRNLGGANGQYDLFDAPFFDNDMAINGASFTSSVVGNPGGLLFGTGPWSLANDQIIPAGAIHSYQLSVKVTLDLRVGSGGDNIYRKCGSTQPGDSSPGEGLYNESRIDINNDGILEDSDHDCGDLPYLTINKLISNISSLGGNMYNVTYQLEVKNLGGANGQYDLQDAIGFDNDINVNSASYTTNAPLNPGGVLFGSGPWTLANDQSILSGATHTYLLTVKVTLDLSVGSGGDNIYKPCGSTIKGQSAAGEGLFNEARIDTNNDGIVDSKDSDCGDLPYITHKKTISPTFQNLGGNMYNVTYNIEVKNIGGATGHYDLTDALAFDDDISINGASYSSNVLGNPGGILIGSGPWTLANNQSIAVGSIQTYQIVVKATLDLSTGSGGDNVYRRCGFTNPGDPTAGEGLFNESRIDTNNDGVPDEKSKACGDLPYIINRKTIVSTTPLGGNMYLVNYQIDVRNIGGLSGQYDLIDAPAFDNDITINIASYTSSVAGNPGGPLAGNGPWFLANDLNIAAGALHTYQLSVKVTLDLTAGSDGDNVYRKCGFANPGDPNAGDGLFNKSIIDTNNDGVPENSDKVCGDLPYVTIKKTIADISPLGGNMYNVTYQLEVKNLGGANGQYDLSDAPSFDNDVAINTASYTSSVAGNPGGPLAGFGPWSLANDQSILAGATHTYLLKVKVTLDLRAGSDGDNEYKPCGSILHGPPSAGEGLFNEARIDTNNDGITDDKDRACGDLPYITHKKSLVNFIQNLGGNMYNITYNIEVRNIGGDTGTYDLKDTPAFDDDITINGASYTSSIVSNPGGSLFGTGLWTLANNQNIIAGAIQTYQIVVKVTLDLNVGSGGDNVYRKCGFTNPGEPTPGEGIFNESSIDTNDDRVPDEKSKICGDLPYITNRKTLVSTTPLGGNMYQVNYQIEVRNSGGLTGQYDLIDAPSFDNDITINNASYTLNAAGNPGGPLAGFGPWTLANDINLAAGAMHVYQLSVNVTLDLTAGSGGDNVYRKCGFTNPGDPDVGEGLFNRSIIDTNNDGIPENTDKVCGDLPYIINDKSLGTITPLGGNMYQVNYKIEVRNLGGATGQYDLLDSPGFDNDISINSALYTSNVAGNPGSSLAIVGPWKLADDQSISIGVTHTYNISVKVTLDLNPTSGGNNVYRKCGETTPDSPSSGEGLFNKSSIDTNNDGIPEHTDKVCGDLPYVTSTKTISSVTPLGNNMFEIIYQLQVKNLGGLNGQYDLTDAPGFDNDITINSVSYTSNAPGLPGSALAGSGPWKIANDENIGIGEIHTYQLKIKVTIDLSPGSGGDNVYKKCGQTKPGDLTSGEGIYNESRMDSNNDGIPEETNKVCGDIPYVTHEKKFISATSLGSDMYNIVYNIVVKNLGGVNGQYDLVDAPSFDDDITILNASYASNAPGNAGIALIGTGPWTLANNQAIISEAIHTYQLMVKVNYNAATTSQGDNVYHKCGFSETGYPQAGEGLFNESRLDNNDDGIYEEKYKVCGDLSEIGKYGSRVWDDKNGNGQRDAGEPGIQGIIVTLYDAVTNSVEHTMSTDVNGKYLFENLSSKSYYAKYTLPVAWVFTKANQGPDATDSDVDGSNGAGTNSKTFLDIGEEELINDAGLMKCSMISGDVWFDIDMDGIYDPEEKGINGLKVYIIDAMSGGTVATLTTSTKPGTASDDGYYKSACLNPGMYYVQFERPGHLGASAPYKGTDPNKDSDITHENGINTTKKFTVLSGDIISNVGAGFQTKSLVGDKVWIDQNANGLQDNGEQPLSGVKVIAYNNKGVKISESQSGSDGKFMLDGLVQGDVYVKFEVPNPKYGFTVPHAGIDDVDSDVDGTYGYGTTKMYKILAGETRPTIDAGVVSQVLALEWLQFDGIYNGSFTELNWTTGVEDNNDHFVVERKYESEKNFAEIGKVNADSDPSLAKHDYQYDDFEVNRTGVYYYRIKQVDNDGSYTYSRTISIRVSDDNDVTGVSIYPNPVKHLLKIELWIPKDTELEVKVYDANGKSVMIAPFSQFKSRGKYNELLSTTNLITGQYVLQIKTSSEVIHKKFTVSR